MISRRTILAATFVGLLGSAPAPADAAPAYMTYAERLLSSLPKGAVLRPDLEEYLNALADQARKKAGKKGLTASNLLRTPARAQALEMFIGNFVGHHSASGYRFAQRFEAFADPDVHGDRGENAARDRQRGEVSKAKARRLFRQWLNSAGHKRNLMNRYYSFVSTGVIQHRHHLYAVQIFWEK